QANGIQTDAPYFDTNDMLANAVAFPAMGVGHMGAAAGMGAVDQHVQRAAAESAREDALSLWNNNGLSPSARIDPTRRIEPRWADVAGPGAPTGPAGPAGRREPSIGDITSAGSIRSEEHTSELQSRSDLVCRLL